jgi:hypothetical protein
VQLLFPLRFFRQVILQPQGLFLAAIQEKKNELSFLKETFLNMRRLGIKRGYTKSVEGILLLFFSSWKGDVCHFSFESLFDKRGLLFLSFVPLLEVRFDLVCVYVCLCIVCVRSCTCMSFVFPLRCIVTPENLVLLFQQLFHLSFPGPLVSQPPPPQPHQEQRCIKSCVEFAPPPPHL